MIVTCPGCKFSKNIPEARLEQEGLTATCPRCRTQFAVDFGAGRTRLVRGKVWIAVLLLGICAAWLIIEHDWKLDRDYFLQPGVWQGEMTYLGKEHPFELVIETARDGQMTGYMDWVGMSPRYRLAVRGTYEGNHLLFEDYAFLEKKGTSGLYDRKDVYIIGNEMTGTDKNGAALFHALKRESTPF
jgi:hypothetical protein